MSMHALLAVNVYWHLPIVIVVISLVYSATRFERWLDILLEAGRWALRMASFLFIVFLALYVVAQFGMAGLTALMITLGVVVVGYIFVAMFSPKT